MASDLIERIEARLEGVTFWSPDVTVLPSELRELLQTITALRSQLQQAREALAPFAKIKPSSLHPKDGSENEQYVVLLKDLYSNPADFTGADLARARATLAPPSTTKPQAGADRQLVMDGLAELKCRLDRALHIDRWPNPEDMKLAEDLLAWWAARKPPSTADAEGA